MAARSRRNAAGTGPRCRCLSGPAEWFNHCHKVALHDKRDELYRSLRRRRATSWNRLSGIWMSLIMIAMNRTLALFLGLA